MIQWTGVICTLLLMTTVGVVSPLMCPSSASDWDRASRGLQCQPPNFYHCLRDESGVITEQCLPRVWIQPQMCPEFNSRVSRVDVYQCTVTNCPTSLYWSNAVFMYPICFENGSATSPSKPGSTVTTLEKTSLFEHDFRSTKATIVLGQTSRFDKSKDSGDESSPDESLPVGAIVGSIIGVIVLCVVGVIIILVYYKRRHRKGNNGGQADENVISEVGTLSDAVKNENETNEAIELLEEQADGNAKSEVSKPPEKGEKGTEINETSYLLNDESSSKPKESKEDGYQKEQADGNVKSEVSKPSEEQADGNAKSEDSKPPEKGEKGTEINETSYLLNDESSSKPKESREDGYQKEQADGNVKSEVSKPSEKVKNEKEIHETSKLLGNESSSEPKESVKVECQVYVVESQKPKAQSSVPKDESSVRVLILVLNNPINNVEMNSKAKETFGKNYNYCWTLSYYQEHKQKESVPLFPKNFDFERASGKEICEKIRDVGLERDVNFVITVPLNVWSAQRDELSSFLNEDKKQCFKNEYW